MGSSRFKRPPGAIFGHVPDAAAKLPTTSADRSFMMATAREQANYKRLSWCRAWAQMVGFRAPSPRPLHFYCDAKERYFHAQSRSAPGRLDFGVIRQYLNPPEKRGPCAALNTEKARERY